MSWLRRFSRVPRPSFVQAYLDNVGSVPGRKEPLETLRFVVLDTETTGFAADKDRILSVATVPVHDSRISVAGTRSWLVFQRDAALNPAVKIHGILPGETAGGEPEAAMLEELLPLLHGAVIVGHHITFDVRMLNAALKRHFKTALRNPVLDTAALAMSAVDAFNRTAYPGQQPPPLDQVCALCEVPMVDRHTAEGDAFTTADLLLVLLSRLRRRLGRPLVAGDLPIVKL